jgi:NADPH-dependent 2,4-dienoyl-CoA reductase/sulfur reductase-like enzyme
VVGGGFAGVICARFLRRFDPRRVVTLVEAIAIDVQSSEVTLADGTRVGYDRLIVAPGIMRSPATANLPRAIPLASSPGR